MQTKLRDQAISPFELALAAANGRGQRLDIGTVLRLIDQTISNIGAVLKDTKAEPITALAELGLLEVILENVSPLERDSRIARALERVQLCEARIFRQSADSAAHDLSSRRHFVSRAIALIDRSLAGGPRTDGERVEAEMQLAEVLTFGAEMRRAELLRKRIGRSDNLYADLFFEARELLIRADDLIERYRRAELGVSNEVWKQLEGRLWKLFDWRHLPRPDDSVRARQTAVSQNIELLWGGGLDSLSVVKEAVVAEPGLLGIERIMGAANIGRFSLYGQFAPLVVAHYLRQQLGDRGRVIAVDVPAGHAGERLGDFDLVFEITRTKNAFMLPKRVFLAEIKCQHRPMSHAEILDLQARTKLLQSARDSWGKDGLPKGAEIMAIEVNPNPASGKATWSLGNLNVDVRKLSLELPFTACSIPGVAIAKPTADMIAYWQAAQTDMLKVIAAIRGQSAA